MTLDLGVDEVDVGISTALGLKARGRGGGRGQVEVCLCGYGNIQLQTFVRDVSIWSRDYMHAARNASFLCSFEAESRRCRCLKRSARATQSLSTGRVRRGARRRRVRAPGADGVVGARKEEVVEKEKKMEREEKRRGPRRDERRRPDQVET